MIKTKGLFPYIKKCGLPQKYYYLAFCCALIWQGIEWTTAETVLFIPCQWIKFTMQGLFVIFLGVSLVLQKRTALEYVVITCLTLLLLVSAIKCDNKQLLISFLLIAAARDISFKAIGTIVFAFSTTVLLLTLVNAYFGNLEIVYSSYSATRMPRSAWGFTHPNRFGYTIFLICLAWFSIRFPRVGIYDSLLWIPALMFLIVFVGARTSAGALVLLVVSTYVFQHFRTLEKDKYIAFGILVLGIILIFLSVYFMIFYNGSNPLHVKLDTILSGRLHLSNEYFTSYSIKLFGNNYADAPVRASAIGGEMSSFVVDNVYSRVLLLYGVIPALIAFGLFVTTCLKAMLKNKVPYSLLCLSVVMVLGFAEYTTIIFTSNFALLAFSSSFQPHWIKQCKSKGFDLRSA